MKVTHQFLSIFFIISLILTSCDSEEAFDCVKQAGETETRVIEEFPEFMDLILHDDISLEIIESDKEYFELTYGKNLLSNITFRLENDSLLIHNTSFCGWTRDYKKPLIKWHTNKERIYINSQTSGKIYSLDTLTKNLQIDTREISNTIELTVSNNSTAFSSNSISKFNIVGNCNELSVVSFFSDSRFELGELIAKRVNVLQRGYNDIIVNPTDSLIGSIENAGRVFYFGNPGIKMLVENGGELIQINE